MMNRLFSLLIIPIAFIQTLKSQNIDQHVRVYFYQFQVDDPTDGILIRRADEIKNILESRLKVKAQNCDNLSVLTNVDLKVADISKDLARRWCDNYNICNSDSIGNIPGNANIIVFGKLNAQNRFEIKIEVLSIKEKTIKSVTFARSDEKLSLINFFDDTRLLRKQTDKLYKEAFGKLYYKKLKLLCKAKLQGKPLTPPIMLSSVSVLAFAYSYRWGNLSDYNSCPLLTNSDGCVLYYDVYASHTDPTDPTYPYSYQGEELSRDGVYDKANKKFRREQLILRIGGVGLLLFTWRDYIPLLKEIKFNKKSKLSITPDNIENQAFQDFGIGSPSGIGVTFTLEI